MMNTRFDQAALQVAANVPRKDESRDAAKRSIDRVGKALEKVFADARARQA